MPRKAGRESTRLQYPLDGTEWYRYLTLADENRYRCGIAGCGRTWDGFTGGVMGRDAKGHLYPVCPTCTVDLVGDTNDPPF